MYKGSSNPENLVIGNQYQVWNIDYMLNTPRYQLVGKAGKYESQLFGELE
jgi:hypothetical protein